MGVGPRLALVDLRDTAAPRVVGRSEMLPDVVRDIVVRDDLAFVAAGQAGLRVFDVQDDRQVQVASIEMGALAWRVDVEGRHAYVLSRSGAGSDNELRIYDVGDIARPRHVGTMPFDHPVEGLDVVGDLAYVTVSGAGAGLSVIDIGSPGRPRRIAHADERLWWQRDVVVRDRRAYVVAGLEHSGVLRVYDVSEPSAPRLLGSMKSGSMWCSMEGGGPPTASSSTTSRIQQLPVSYRGLHRTISTAHGGRRLWRWTVATCTSRATVG